jgi:hypothetical protein
VILLEKAPELGGTRRKAAFWYWVPNNAPMRGLGIEDREEDFLRYMARALAPAQYDPGAPTLGLSEWEFALCRRDLRERLAAAELLAERGRAALPALSRTCPTTGPSCRRTRRRRAGAACPEDARETMSRRRQVGVRTMSEAAARDGVDIRTGHRVQRLVTDGGAVVGSRRPPRTGAVRCGPARR